MSLLAPYWLVLAIPLLVLIIYQWPKWDNARRIVRSLMLGLVLLALANLSIRGEAEVRRVHLVVDTSSSLRGAGITAAEDVLRGLQGNNVELTVVAAGRQPKLLRSGFVDGLRRADGADESALDRALQLVAGMANDTDQSGSEVLLITDGLYTGDDPLGRVGALTATKTTVHVMHIANVVENDAAITRFEVPTRVAKGHAYAMQVQVFSPKAQAGKLELVAADGSVLLSQDVQLRQGDNDFNLPWRAGVEGLSQYRMRLVTSGDQRVENNTANAVLEVVGEPRVLLVSQATIQGAGDSALARALRQTGMQVELYRGKQPLRSAMLKHYAVVVLENMPLDKLNDGADAALANYVQRLGGGLLVTGGRASYAMGGYYLSRVEPLLPVALDRQEEFKRPKLAMAIVLDRSGSMGAAAVGGTKMDLANRGSVEAINLLHPRDEVAVFAVDTGSHQVVPLSEVGSNRAAIKDRTLSIESMGGGIYVYTGLRAAVRELLKSDASSRHIVLFADAGDAEEPGDYRALIENWVKAGGTISVIGLGQRSDPDADFLEDVAHLGGGRAFFTNDAANLPRVFTQDVMQVARSTFVRQATNVVPQAGLLSLQMPFKSVPAVAGYNLTFVVPDTEVLLSTADENKAPLAAMWSRGQGKVAAVMFEADGPHTGPLGGWQHYSHFFRTLAESLRAADKRGALVADMTLKGRMAEIVLEVPKGAQLPATPKAMLMSPDETGMKEVRLHWRSPRELVAQVPLGSDGIYHGAVAIEGLAPAMLPARVLPYSPEFAPARTGDPSGWLRDLATATGGLSISHVDSMLEQKTVSKDWQSLRLWLLLAALLLLLFDSAQRRGLLWRRSATRKMQKPKKVRQPRKKAEKARPPAADIEAPAPGVDEPEVRKTSDDAEQLGESDSSESVFAKAKRKAGR